MWEYGVTYKENLVLLPFISHLNRAVYRVMPENKKGHEPFRIDSEHICCMFFLCREYIHTCFLHPVISEFSNYCYYFSQLKQMLRWHSDLEKRPKQRS